MSLSFEEVVQTLAAAKIPSPRMEARILLEHISGNPLGRVESDEEKKLRNLIAARINHTPLDKLLGGRDFYKNRFLVNESVLSPRPDTEILVEAAVRLIKQHKLKRILDLGTGSGCIILSILADCPETIGVAVDKSEAALEVARKNADALGLTQRVSFVNSSWFDRDFVKALGTGLEMIVSNPPYIPSPDIASLEPEVKDHDPLSALDGGADGFDHYKKIAEATPLLLAENGYILLEVGIGQAQTIKDIFAEKGLKPVEILPDLSGTERCVILKK